MSSSTVSFGASKMPQFPLSTLTRIFSSYAIVNLLYQPSGRDEDHDHFIHAACNKQQMWLAREAGRYHH